MSAMAQVPMKKTRQITKANPQDSVFWDLAKENLPMHLPMDKLRKLFFHSYFMIMNVLLFLWIIYECIL